MKFICFTLVYVAGATSASCDSTPEDDLVSALQYGVKVRDMPAATARPWQCHNYAEGQNNQWCRETSEHEGSEIRFSQGDDTKAPGCGKCWCCSKPAPSPAVLPPVFAGTVEHSDWKCHAYDESAGENNAWCARNPRKAGFQMRFTAGNNKLAPGCGDDCWCCKRDTRPKSPDWYGNIQMCEDKELVVMDDGKTSATCWGSNQFGCTKKHLIDQCRSLEQACCSDKDGTCADNDYRFSCVQPAAPDWYGKVQMCGDQELVTMNDGTTATCRGGSEFGCSKAHLVNVCGSLGQACCSDQDGTCANKDYSFSCVKQAALPKATMTEPAANPEPAPAPQPQFNCMTRERWSAEKTTWCAGQHATEPAAKPEPEPAPAPAPQPPFNCMTRERWSAEKKKWCAGQHAPSPAVVVSGAPAWMAAIPLCESKPLLFKRCSGTNKWSCTEEDLKMCTKYGQGACCSDADGNCADDDYAFSCIK